MDYKKINSLSKDKDGYYEKEEIFNKLTKEEIIMLMFIHSSYQETFNCIRNEFNSIKNQCSDQSLR